MIEEDVVTNARVSATKHLGLAGRLITGSKSSYLDRHPNNQAFFNANVATKEHGKLWYGDLDLSTKDKEALEELASELETTVYVLREMDGRFGMETKLPFDRAVASFSPHA